MYVTSLERCHLGVLTNSKYIPIQKPYNWKKFAPSMEYFWKDLGYKNKVAPEGTLLELEKGSEPYNCCEFVIIIFVVLSLHGNQDIPYVNNNICY